MSDLSVELESAETRVAASRADIALQVHALKSRARRLVKSPYVMGGLVIGAAAAAYLTLARRGKPRAQPSRPTARGSLTSVLKKAQMLLPTAQMLLPLLGALAAAAAPKRNPSTSPLVTPQSASAVQKSAAAVPQGNWFSQQL